VLSPLHQLRRRPYLQPPGRRFKFPRGIFDIHRNRLRNIFQNQPTQRNEHNRRIVLSVIRKRSFLILCPA